MEKSRIKFYFLGLSLICIVMFILQNLPGIPGFTENFVLNDKAIDNYQIWRFITAIFLHGSITHLVYNLFALLFFGIILEKLIGSRNFLRVFLISGIVANIVSVNFYTSSLGASGAIMGIMGAIVLLRPMMMVWAFGLILPMCVAIILWIIGDILSIFMPSNVGNIAHLSGVGMGFIFGLFLRKKLIKKDKQIEREVISEHHINSWERRFMKK